jgi:hypothetical protein
MNHLLFAVALQLKLDWNHYRQGEYSHQRDHQKQIEQNITLFAPPSTA